MTDDAIVETFDALIEWWEASEDARYDLENFRRVNQEPTPPVNLFGDVKELVAYNRLRWQYEQELEDLTARHEKRMGEFNELTQKVKLLLPVGRTLSHTYSGDNPDLQGARYSIHHLYAQRRRDPSEVSVEKTGVQRPPAR